LRKEIVVMKKICERCGKKFDEHEAADFFGEETLKDYSLLTECLCGECAVEAMDNKESIYFEECADCHSQFDPFEVELELCSRTHDEGAELDMFDRPLCLDCALCEYDKLYR
jgi:hypothetical protein